MDNWYVMYSMGREKAADTLEYARIERLAAGARVRRRGQSLWLLLISLVFRASAGQTGGRIE